jgi:protein-disulfide isomerase
MSKLIPPVGKDDHVQGLPGASIELVEYGDFQCPHCGAAHPVVKEIQKTYGKDLRFIFRHFPLASIHAYAVPAAMAAEAAGRQKKFWPMHDLIFENQESLSDHMILELATTLKLDIPAFRIDLQDEALAAIVESNFESGVRSGVNGTPSFFINGLKYNGSYNLVSMVRALENVMKEAG